MILPRRVESKVSRYSSFLGLLAKSVRTLRRVASRRAGSRGCFLCILHLTAKDKKRIPHQLFFHATCQTKKNKRQCKAAVQSGPLFSISQVGGFAVFHFITPFGPNKQTRTRGTSGWLDWLVDWTTLVGSYSSFFGWEVPRTSTNPPLHLYTLHRIEQAGA